MVSVAVIVNSEGGSHPCSSIIPSLYKSAMVVVIVIMVLMVGQ